MLMVNIKYTVFFQISVENKRATVLNFFNRESLFRQKNVIKTTTWATGTQENVKYSKTKTYLFRLCLLCEWKKQKNVSREYVYEIIYEGSADNRNTIFLC